MRFQQVESLSPPKAGNLIDMYEQKGHLVEHKTIFWVASFIDRHSLAAGFMKDLVVRSSICRPEAEEEIGRKFGQSLPRCGLIKLVA